MARSSKLSSSRGKSAFFKWASFLNPFKLFSLPQMKLPQWFSRSRFFVIDGKNLASYWLSLFLVLFVWTGFSIWSQDYGMLHVESENHLIDYIDDSRTFLQRVFNPHANDFGTFQVRELSYVVDDWDANILAHFFKAKIPHFFSPSYFLMIYLIVLFQFYRAIKYIKLRAIYSLLISFLFLSTPCIFFSNYFYRSAKIGAAFCIFFLVWSLFIHMRPYKEGDEREGEGLSGKFWIFSKFFLLASAAGVFDRMGYFVIILSTLAIGLVSFFRKLAKKEIALTALILSIIINQLYSEKLSEVIVLHLNGYSPDHSYMSLDLRTFFENLPTFMNHGYVIFIDSFRFFLGAFSLHASSLILIFLLGLLAFLGTPGRPVKVARGPFFTALYNQAGLLFFLSIFLGMIFMNALTILRHSPMIWPDLKRLYYPIPMTVISMFFVTYCVMLVEKRAGKKGRKFSLITIVLSIFVLNNVGSLAEHNQVYQKGHLSGRLDASNGFAEAIRNMDDPEITYSDYMQNSRVFKILMKRFYGREPELKKVVFVGDLSPEEYRIFKEEGIMPEEKSTEKKLDQGVETEGIEKKKDESEKANEGLLLSEMPADALPEASLEGSSEISEGGASKEASEVSSLKIKK